MNKCICKSFTFEAAHSLNTTKNSKNKNIHGHSFHVRVFVEGKVKKDGMILDFFILYSFLILKFYECFYMFFSAFC